MYLGSLRLVASHYQFMYFSDADTPVIEQKISLEHTIEALHRPATENLCPDFFFPLTKQINEFLFSPARLRLLMIGRKGIRRWQVGDALLVT